MDTVIQAFLTQKAQFLGAQSVHIKYELYETQQFTPTKYGHPEGAFRIELGKMGASYFTRVIGEPESTSPTERIAVLHEGRAAERFLGGIVISPSPTGQAYVWWTYTDNIFLNIYEDFRGRIEALHENSPEFNQPFLPEMLIQNRDRYYVIRDTAIDDTACWLVEWPERDRIWVDPARGFAVLRRELFWNETRPAQTLKVVHINGEFEKVSNGLWLPTAQTVELYADPKLENFDTWGKKTNSRKYRLTEIRFGTLDDSFFHIEARPGDRIRDLTLDAA